MIAAGPMASLAAIIFPASLAVLQGETACRAKLRIGVRQEVSVSTLPTLTSTICAQKACNCVVKNHNTTRDCTQLKLS